MSDDTFDYKLTCSFCRKRTDEVTWLIAIHDTNHSVAICDECIGTCNEIIFEAFRRKPTRNELP